MLNDYRYWTERSVDFYQLFTRFYRRLAGVVLKRSGAPTEEAVQRRIFIKRSHEDGFEHVLIDVEFPDFDFEGGGEGDSVTETNFACLKFILDFEDMTAIRAFAEEDNNRWKLLDYVTVQFMIMVRKSRDVVLFVEQLSPISGANDLRDIGRHDHDSGGDLFRRDAGTRHQAQPGRVPRHLHVRPLAILRPRGARQRRLSGCVRCEFGSSQRQICNGVKDFRTLFQDDMCRLDGSRLQLLVQQGGSDAGQNAPA